jgi:hypothetical protein
MRFFAALLLTAALPLPLGCVEQSRTSTGFMQPHADGPKRTRADVPTREDRPNREPTSYEFNR